MTEYVCVTVLAYPGESEPAFRTRLVAFWTHVLRQWPADYEKVYAEAIAFEAEDHRLSRQYMVEPDAVPVLTAELTAAGIAVGPVDMEDLYSKAEASSTDWFQIGH